MSILVIDNYDSFTYNLVQLIYGASHKGISVVVKRNDAMTLDRIRELNPSHIIISPGPGSPKDSGVSREAVHQLHKLVPILGVCLGHQVICEVFGGLITRAPTPVHGKACLINHDGNGCFKGLPSPMTVARYHSLIAQHPVGEDLIVTAKTGDLIMGVSHKTSPLHGVQFHPESFLTPHGVSIMRNFLSL